MSVPGANDNTPGPKKAIGFASQSNGPNREVTYAFDMNRSRRIALIVLCVGLPLLYALSTGPVVYLRTSGRLILSEQAFETVYYPLLRAEHHIPPFGDLMHGYVEWWERDPQDLPQGGH